MKTHLIMGSYAMLLLFSTAVYAQQNNNIEGENSKWSAKAGLSAVFNSGNSVNQTIGGNADVTDKWNSNELAFHGDGAYGRAKDNTTGVTSTNTKNWKLSVRYGRYFSKVFSLYLLQGMSADKPAGFNFIYNSSLGISHEVFPDKPHTFKYELGFDYAREWRDLSADEDIYSARAYWKYAWAFAKKSELSQDFEALFNMEDKEDTRINTFTALTVKMTDIVAFQAGFKVKFDNVPVPDKKKTDTTTQFGLVFDIL